MISKLFWATLMVCISICTGWAQDPTTVEPTHYKLDFENEHVQVVSVHYGPHEKSSLHEHPGGVVVTLTVGHLRFTDEKGNKREVYAKPGEVRWFAPFKHRVENLSDAPYDAVYIGVKSVAGRADIQGTRDPAFDQQTEDSLSAIFASIKR